MTDIEDVVKLKRQIKKLEQEKERANGRVEQLLKTIKNEFGCEALEDAETLLAEKEKRQRQLEKKYETEHGSFMEKWSEKLL